MGSQTVLLAHLGFPSNFQGVFSNCRLLADYFEKKAILLKRFSINLNKKRVWNSTPQLFNAFAEFNMQVISALMCSYKKNALIQRFF